MTPEEYRNYFPALNSMRRHIALRFPLEDGMHVLDLACGYGYNSFETARLNDTVHVTGIDLSQDGVRKARKGAKDAGISDRVEFIGMDSTNMDFPDDTFDMAVNFLGLEDIHMTRGREGVVKTFREVSRVLKPGCPFILCTMPCDEMETPAQKLEVEIYSFICGATWLSLLEYEDLLTDCGFRLLEKTAFHTGKKLSVEQAAEEIKFCCEMPSKLYGVKTRSYDEAWSRFGDRIEKNGLGQCSRVILLITVSRKSDNIDE